MLKFKDQSAPTLIRRLLYGVLPAVAVSLCAVSVLNYIVARDQLGAEIRSNLEVLTERARLNVESFVNQREQDLQTIAESPLITDYHKNLDYGLTHEAQVLRQELEQYLATFARRTRVYDSISYLDREGKVIAGVEYGAVVTPGTQQPYPHDADTQQRSGVSCMITGAGKHRQLAVYLERADDSETARGRFLLACNLAHLESELIQMRIGRSGGAWIVNTAGEAIIGVPIRGEAAYRSELPLTTLPWRVVIQADGEEFVAPLADLRNFTILFSCVIAIVVTLALGHYIYRITRPISDMVIGTQHLASGDLTYRFADPNVKELQTLAEAFNDMAERLSCRTDELESRVRQLTALRAMEGTVLERRDQETILRACLRSVADALQVDRVGLYWIDREAGAIVGRYLHGAAEMGLFEPLWRQRRVMLGGTDILNDVVRDRCARLVHDPAAAPGVDQRFVQESRTREFVLAPLCGKDQVFGIITADNFFSARPLEDADKETLMLFASAAGMALENFSLVEQLGESESRYRTVLDNSPVAIIGLTIDHRILTWNRGAETVFGYSAREMLQRPLRDLFGPDSRPDLQKLLLDVAEHGSVKDHEIKAQTKTGAALELSISGGGADPDFWRNREWAVVIRDVTRDRQLQRQLISSEKLTAVGQLIAGIAHELNNPLQAVVGYAELLANHSGVAAAKQELRCIHENATRCRKIIENLLLFVRQGDVVKKPVLVEQVIRASVDLLAHKLKKIAGVKAQVQIVTPGLRVRGNFQQLEQVLINLIGNACDAMQNWNGGREILLRAERSGEQVIINVADNGPGIPPHVLARIWEPFFTTKSEGHGTGLGLPLCQQIIGDHDGTLTVTSTAGRGTTFTICLAATDEELAEAAPVEAAAPTASGAEILIVEDDRSVRALMNDVVAAQGYRVQTADCLEEAFRCVASKRFDLVVTDLNLGDGTGVDLFNGWPQRTSQARPPFVFLTADLIANDLEQLCEQHGLRMVHKPVDLRELRAVVREALAKAQAPVGAGE